MLDIKRVIGSARIQTSNFRRQGYNKFLINTTMNNNQLDI